MNLKSSSARLLLLVQLCTPIMDEPILSCEHSQKDQECASVRSQFPQDRCSKGLNWSTSPPLFLTVVPRLLFPYDAEIWLLAIFQLINECLCCICNECVLAETWSSSWPHWVPFRIIAFTFVVCFAGVAAGSHSRGPEHKKGTFSEEPNYKRICLKLYTESVSVTREMKKKKRKLRCTLKW